LHFFINNRSILVSVRIPTQDGSVNCYDLGNSGATVPRIYFVNGIRVMPREHSETAAYLSLLIEHPVWGVYNQTAGQKLGSIVDILQCILDFAHTSVARTTSSNNLGKSPKVPENKIDEFLREIEKKYHVWNRATLELFRQLVIHRHERQLIIAHSQGNLITSNALFVLEDVLGAAGLSNIRVYSLASPAPAWPVGLRISNGGGGRQDNAFMNDMVALLRPHNLAKKIGVDRFQNAGDFRTYSGSGPVALAPHDVNKIIESLNFLKSIRRDLGLTPDLSPDFLRKASEIAQTQISSTGGASGSW